MPLVLNAPFRGRPVDQNAVKELETAQYRREMKVAAAAMQPLPEDVVLAVGLTFVYELTPGYLIRRHRISNAPPRILAWLAQVGFQPGRGIVGGSSGHGSGGGSAGHGSGGHSPGCGSGARALKRRRFGSSR